MMDFLRRLAPTRETDAARAVAVLPSRFSEPYPLLGIHDQAQPAPSLDDDKISLRPPAGLPPMGSPMSARLRHAATPAPPGPTSPPAPLTGETRRRENEQAMAPATVPAKAFGAPQVPPVRAVQDGAGGNAGHASLASPQATHPAAVMAALPALEQAGVPLAPAQGAWPLSDASLAQRISRPQDDGQVVHVTIGRIEVVAHTAAAPAPARGPASRQPSVTLADYLRGSPGGRP